MILKIGNDFIYQKSSIIRRAFYSRSGAIGYVSNSFAIQIKIEDHWKQSIQLKPNKLDEKLGQPSIYLRLCIIARSLTFPT